MDLAALLEPFLDRALAPAQLGQISTYIDLLLRWNARINLTAIRNPEEIVIRHFGESFFMARHLFPHLSTPCHPERSQVMSKANGLGESKSLPRASRGDPYSSTASASIRYPEGAPSKFRLGGGVRVIDLGSGAGFPALPIKIWAPHIQLTLVESNHKKAAFLREVARALTLMNVDVFAERAEALSARLDPEFPKADVVTLRAVENFDRILPLAATFLAPHGRLALLITTAQLPKLQPAKLQTPKLKTLPTLTWRTIPVPQSKARILSIVELQ